MTGPVHEESPVGAVAFQFRHAPLEQSEFDQALRDDMDCGPCGDRSSDCRAYTLAIRRFVRFEDDLVDGALLGRENAR